MRRDVMPLLESGEIKPVIYAEIPLPAAAKAHSIFEAGGVTGRIVLTNPAVVEQF